MAKDSIDEHIDKLLRENPILSDEEFKRRFPGIMDVITFIDSVAITTQRATGRYKLFDRLGVGNIGDYLELLQKDDKEAVRIYKVTRDTLGFGQEDIG